VFEQKLNKMMMMKMMMKNRKVFVSPFEKEKKPRFLLPMPARRDKPSTKREENLAIITHKTTKKNILLIEKQEKKNFVFYFFGLFYKKKNVCSPLIGLLHLHFLKFSYSQLFLHLVLLVRCNL
jgi:hypothetical protein